MHQCVHCGKLYPTASKELLQGCPCGSKFFFFIREENLKELKEKEVELTEKEKKEIEKDVREIIGIKEEKPVVLDLENIRITKPGKFEIDLVSLFKRKPIIYRIEEGKYVIDVASTFYLMKKKR